MPQPSESYVTRQALKGSGRPLDDVAQMILSQSGSPEEARVIALIKNIGVPAILCDADGNVVMVNSLASAVLGSRAVPGEKLHHLISRPRDAEALKAIWYAKSGLGKGWSTECTLIGQDGTLIDVHMVAIPVWATPAGTSSWLVILPNLNKALLDTRELTIYAQELGQLYRTNKTHKRQIQELEEAKRSREYFYSLVSHELKTPLTSLIAALEMISAAEPIPPPESHDAWRLVGSMKRSASRLERLINDLLDVASAQSGGLSLHLNQVNLVEVIQTVIDEMTPLIAEKDLSLFGPTQYKNGVIVKGDEIRLKQILQNLLSNATKAAPRNGVIRISVARKAEWVKTSVTNPGVVLDASIKNSLFEPFRKSSAGGYKTGAGLGLAVVDALVKAHGGSVAVRSGRRQVTFSFTIPLWNRATGL